MDSLEASHLMSRMISLIEGGYTDGQQNTWETYKLLRGEGYSLDEIRELHRLKRELQLAIQESGPDHGNSAKIERIMHKFEAGVK